MIGPNGAGKTTLFRMIIGEEKPDAGTLKVGETVQLAYVDQGRELERREHRVPGSERRARHDHGRQDARSTRARISSSFNFRGTDQQKKVGDLSGGERNRLHLAKMLKSGGNLLLLDEPTNDLDVDTLRALEEALDRFRGLRGGDLARSLVPRSHRDAHPRVRGRRARSCGSRGTTRSTTRICSKRKGADADQPHRIKYKKLVRG